jgi:hypothetical protein
MGFTLPLCKMGRREKSFCSGKMTVDLCRMLKPVYVTVASTPRRANEAQDTTLLTEQKANANKDTTRPKASPSKFRCQSLAPIDPFTSYLCPH